MVVEWKVVVAGRRGGGGGGGRGGIAVGLPHPVGVVLADVAQLSIEIDLDLKVEVSHVSCVGFHGEHTGHLIPLLAGEVVVQVEYSLLPVCGLEVVCCCIWVGDFGTPSR